MNWIIQRTEKMEYHTHLDAILEPIKDTINNFNWIMSDLELNTIKDLPINYEDEYFVLSPLEFKSILDSYTQFIWGVVIAVPIDIEIKIEKGKIPYSEGNDLAWQNDNIQHPHGKIEIICFDSTLTIVKFADKYLSDKFKVYFGKDAIELENPAKFLRGLDNITKMIVRLKEIASFLAMTRGRHRLTKKARHNRAFVFYNRELYS